MREIKIIDTIMSVLVKFYYQMNYFFEKSLWFQCFLVQGIINLHLGDPNVFTGQVGNKTVLVTDLLGKTKKITRAITEYLLYMKHCSKFV